MLTINDTRILKAVGILMVIFCHVVALFGIRYATPLGGIGVSIFLFVSGYGLNESYKKNGLNKFFRKRFCAVVIPYLIIVLIDAVLNKSNIMNLFKNIILVTTPKFMWFIQFIVVIYLCFYIINKLFDYNKNKYIAWIIIGGIIFYFGNGLWAEQAIIFFIGIIYSDKVEYIEKMDRRNKIVVSIALLILGGIALISKQTTMIRNSSENIYYFIELILKNGTALGIVFFVANDTLIIKYFKKILCLIGNISYELYLIHAIAFFVLRNNVGVIGLIEFIFITVIGAIIFNKLLIYVNKIIL